VRIDRPFERAPEGHAERYRSPKAGFAPAADDSRGDFERLLHGRTLVALVERLRDAKREADFIQPCLHDAVAPALVEREAGVDDPRDAIQRRDDLLRSRHLGHALRVDETRDLYGSHPTGDEAPDELCSNLGREDVGLVLKAVARPHLVDGHASAGVHVATLSK
jgi:hypothetical protein